MAQLSSVGGGHYTEEELVSLDKNLTGFGVQIPREEPTHPKSVHPQVECAVREHQHFSIIL